AELKVRLLPTAADGTRAPFDVPFVGGKGPDLTVLVWAPGFAVAESYAALRVPRTGASDTVTFHLRARDEGKQIVEIKFLLGTPEIGHCSVETEVGAATSSDIAETVTVETMSDTSLDCRSGARAVLIVKTTDDGHLDWQLIDGSGPPRPLGPSPNRFTSQQ